MYFFGTGSVVIAELLWNVRSFEINIYVNINLNFYKW